MCHMLILFTVNDTSLKRFISSCIEYFERSALHYQMLPKAAFELQLAMNAFGQICHKLSLIFPVAVA